MSTSRQIALAILILVLAGGGWLAFERGWLGSGREVASAAQPPGGGNAGGGNGGGGQGGRAGAGGPGGGAAAPPVVTATVAVDNTGLEVQAVGTVAASRAVTLFPEVTGVVAEVTFRPGTLVTAGQPLLRLDDAEQQIALERAQFARDNAAVALERAEQLAKSNNITTVALTDARSAVQRAETDLKSAELDLARRTLNAPFAGTIGLTDVTLGDLINSQKAIATLDDMSTVTVAFQVPERASGQVVVGQEVDATTEALAGKTFTGQISAIDSRVDPVARTLKVEASLPNEANVLKPGMALNVTLSFPGVDRPSVPSLAVQWDRNGPYVWKVNGDTVHRVGVQIVGRLSGTVVVAGEIAAGEHVVVEGLQRVREGAKVNIVGGDGPAAAPASATPPGPAEADGAGARTRGKTEGRT